MMEIYPPPTPPCLQGGELFYSGKVLYILVLDMVALLPSLEKGGVGGG